MERSNAQRPADTDSATSALAGILDDGTPPMPIEALAAVYALDIDHLVPASRKWRTASRAHVRRLVRLMAPVLRALVAEIVILDRHLSAAEDELEQLRPAEPSPTTDSVDPLVAAHAVALRLTQQLTPAPTTAAVERFRWDDGPRVVLTAYNDRSALEAWASQLGTTLEWQPASLPDSVTGSGSCTVDGVRVAITSYVHAKAPVVTS
ncbi:hypothetical protein [Streptomyces rubellomurinus]|uniref:Uncharacterized protein n=1 Tax=Streptomyces rubellomurinus (strain ATCC 31215) TaxID=359131 RepID=A0A0F2TBY1_STRR3|nr:hypothetical protein [Streptomyces rubellomurinus]KJS60669.1 hypothetical protein VM95_19850 [Streptomyces rubellomurinus]